jgi:hypothetical protein
MENKTTIFQKLLKVQAEIAPIKKTEKNPFFNSKFFDINGILEILKPVLTAHGLVLTQPMGIIEGRNVLETWLSDGETGETLKSIIYLPEVSDPQKFGAAVTYYRRYMVQSLLSLQGEDDDANASTAAMKAQPNKKVKTDAQLSARSSAENDMGYESI